MIDLPPYKVVQPETYREYHDHQRNIWYSKLGVVYSSISIEIHISYIDNWQPYYDK